MYFHFLSPLLFVVHRNLSEFWIQATYHIYPKQELFASFRKLDGGLVSFGDGHTCLIEEKGTVHNKLSDEIVRELKDMRYVLTLRKDNFPNNTSTGPNDV